MLCTDFLGGLRGPTGLPGWLRSIGCAFPYWIVFLLALEPGNVLHARSMGHALDFSDEALRIGGAALLGCSTAPLILALSRRFPVSGTRGWRSIVIRAAGAATLSFVLAFVLIVISCVLAAWVLMGQIVPSVAEVRSELAGNWLLVTFALCAFAVMPFQGTTGCGSRQRSSPTGGAANGTPIYIVRAPFVTPSIAPDSTRAGFAHVLAAIRHSAPATLPLRQQLDIDILR